MRVSMLATLPLLGALVLAPHQAPAQISVNIHLETPLTVTNYSPDAYGDWHSRYRTWRPTTVYYYNGKWYHRSVRGARAVVVYRTGNSYFLPPQDQGWNNEDRRYNYRRRPTDEDYRHAAPPPQGRGRGGPPPHRP